MSVTQHHVLFFDVSTSLLILCSISIMYLCVEMSESIDLLFMDNIENFLATLSPHQVHLDQGFVKRSQT